MPRWLKITLAAILATILFIIAIEWYRFVVTAKAPVETINEPAKTKDGLEISDDPNIPYTVGI